MSNVLFQCKDCGGDVVDCRKDGRFYEHRQIIILLPTDFNIPRCLECKQEWFTENLIKELDIVLEQEYQKDAPLIQSILELYKHKLEK